MIKNKLLNRQLKKSKISNLENMDKIDLDNFKKFLLLVESAYDEMDNNLYKIERTLKISTSEARKLNENLEVKIKEEVEKNRKKDEKLFNQSKSASMGEMIENIAHQWRQPLSAISTTATSMQLQIELDIAKEEEIKESYDHIIEYTNFLSQTIDDFRGFLKINEESEIFNICDIINKTKNIIKSVYIENKIKIIYKRPLAQFKTLGMPNALAQVFLNILTNAKDALLSNDIKDKKVFISVEVIDNTNVISFTDIALGIPDDIMPKIFDPYFTTKHQSQGTGIGLHMSKNIIEKSFNGAISVNNVEFKHEGNDYKGACFKITLPIINDDKSSLYVI